MVVPGLAMLITAAAYWFLTHDAPEGNYSELRARGDMPPAAAARGTFMEAIRDSRVIALFFIYAACFGIELTINGTAALYFFNRFDLNLATAGLVAGLFGLMNIFARSMGGVFSDFINRDGGLKGRVQFLFVCLILEGIALIFFANMGVLALAIPALIIFSLFVQMSEGATFAIVPYINKRAMGLSCRHRRCRRQLWRNAGGLSLPAGGGLLWTVLPDSGASLWVYAPSWPSWCASL